MLIERNRNPRSVTIYFFKSAIIINKSPQTRKQLNFSCLSRVPLFSLFEGRSWPVSQHWCGLVVGGFYNQLPLPSNEVGKTPTYLKGLKDARFFFCKTNFLSPCCPGVSSVRHHIFSQAACSTLYVWTLQTTGLLPLSQLLVWTVSNPLYHHASEDPVNLSLLPVWSLHVSPFHEFMILTISKSPKTVQKSRRRMNWEETLGEKEKVGAAPGGRGIHRKLVPSEVQWHSTAHVQTGCGKAALRKLNENKDEKLTTFNNAVICFLSLTKPNMFLCWEVQFPLKAFVRRASVSFNEDVCQTDGWALKQAVQNDKHKNILT